MFYKILFCIIFVYFVEFVDKRDNFFVFVVFGVVIYNSFLLVVVNVILEGLLMEFFFCFYGKEIR